MCNPYQCPICHERCVVCSKKFTPRAPCWDRCGPCTSETLNDHRRKEIADEAHAARLRQGREVQSRWEDADDS
jgi:hypothetical protein